MPRGFPPDRRHGGGCSRANRVPELRAVCMAPAAIGVYRGRTREDAAMHGPRFDAWTRRTFGLTVGGLAACTIGAASPIAAVAKKRKKKRCKKLT